MTDYPTNNLSELLETNPQLFLQYIKNKTPSNIEWANQGCKSYNNWFSPPLHQLVRLTGKLVNPPPNNNHEFFGSLIPDGISEELALEIFHELKKFNLDHEDTDYYQENLEEFLRNREDTICHRTGNERLVKAICKYFQLPDLSSTSTSTNEVEKSYPEPPSCSDPYPYPPEGPPQDPYEDDDNSYYYPVPSPSLLLTAVRPPTYDGHFQNFVDNMDEYERELEQQYYEEEDSFNEKE